MIPGPDTLLVDNNIHIKPKTTLILEFILGGGGLHVINFSPPYLNILTDKEKRFFSLLHYMFNACAKRFQSRKVPIPHTPFRNIIIN